MVSWNATITKEESEAVKLTEAESQKVEQVVLEPSSIEAEGGFIICEVEEQQAVRVEAQLPKRRSVIRVESEETQDYVLERRYDGGGLQVPPNRGHGNGRRW